MSTLYPILELATVIGVGDKVKLAVADHENISKRAARNKRDRIISYCIREGRK